MPYFAPNADAAATFSGSVLKSSSSSTKSCSNPAGEMISRSLAGRSVAFQNVCAIRRAA
jgi:hypothetical protein